MDRCAECGFEYDLAAAPSAGPAIVAGMTPFLAVLGGRDPDGDLHRDLHRGTDVRRRPEPQTWSPLEYCCHVRDVLLVQRERVLTARRTDRPTFEPMGRDERVEHDGYAGQDPGAVGRQLADAASLFANVLARLGAEEWERTVVYGYPATMERNLRWVATHTLHEVRHHLLDVHRQIPTDAGR